MFRTSSVHHQERFVQAVCADLVCGNTRTTRHVQPLQSCRKNSSKILLNYVRSRRLGVEVWNLGLSPGHSLLCYEEAGPFYLVTVTAKRLRYSDICTS